MLHELHIRNFAIIDDLHLVFGPGLNILTGETGAGKSIIIDAIGLLLGDRATAEWVRAGCDLAEIEAIFHFPSGRAVADELNALIAEQGLDDPDNPHFVQLVREVRLNGRNICRVNGRAVSLQILSEITSLLVDIHGQGEHLSLLRPKSHIHLLDRYAGLILLRAEVGQQVRRLRAVRSELQRLQQDARTIAQRLDMLGFQAEEIRAANLRSGEDGELDSERRRLANAEALLTLAQSAQATLVEGESEMPAALDMLSEVVGRMERLVRIDPDMREAADNAQALLEQFSDLARTLQDYADELEFNPDRLNEVEERIELIANLKRKYGDTIDQIIEFGQNAQDELDSLGNWEAKTVELEMEEKDLLHVIGALAVELSEKRRAAGDRMGRQVERELSDLRMDKARFGVQIAQTENENGAFLADGRRAAFDATGIDRIEFLISANPGEPLKPMAKVASGGETARLMLALKSVLTAADDTPTLIFDEIDQGIGGRVGAVVGRKLWNLTGAHGDDRRSEEAAHQVLCITHLPQLAAFGDQHFTVNKEILAVNGEERTTTAVRRLDGGERVQELMLMLGATSDAGRRSVEEMLVDVAASKAGSKHQT